jgi:hypothetical protein
LLGHRGIPSFERERGSVSQPPVLKGEASDALKMATAGIISNGW